MGDAAGIWVAAFVASQITVLLALWGAGLLDDDADPRDLSMGWFVVANSGLWITMVVLTVVVVNRKGDGVVPDLGLRAKPRDALVGGVSGVLTQWPIIPLLYLPLWYFTDIDPDKVGERAEQLTDNAVGLPAAIALIVAVGVIAPIVEEMFYRGLVQRAMQRRLGEWTGVLVTAVLFGAVHFSWLELPALIVAGLLFGALAKIYGRLGPAIAAHMAFNMFTVVTLLATSGGS